jgi:hypothetical protein
MILRAAVLGFTLAVMPCGRVGAAICCRAMAQEEKKQSPYGPESFDGYDGENTRGTGSKPSPEVQRALEKARASRITPPKN